MKTILMNTEMTKAILDGRKVQFRELTNQLIRSIEKGHIRVGHGLINHGTVEHFIETMSKYQVGDVLWVGEDYKIGGWYVHSASSKGYGFAIDHSCEPYDTSWHRPMTYGTFSDMLAEVHQELDDINYPNNGAKREYRWEKFKSPLEIMDKSTMEEWMARTFIKITNVRVERLQDISVDDILKEGFPLESLTKDYGDKELIDKCLEWWINIWNSTAPKGYKWEDNPYVFVYEFERVEK